MHKHCCRVFKDALREKGAFPFHPLQIRQNILEGGGDGDERKIEEGPMLDVLRHNDELKTMPE